MFCVGEIRLILYLGSRVLTSFCVFASLPVCSSSVQEAIGAQYMQRHLPKLEPFLRRVVSTSLLPLLLATDETVVHCNFEEFLMEFSPVSVA
jgi:hypothetical protein